MRFWQDLDKTIPAEKDGDRVAVMEQEFGPDMLSPDPKFRPTLRGGVCWIDGVEKDKDDD